MKANLNFSPKPFVRRDPVNSFLFLLMIIMCIGCAGSFYYYWSIKSSQNIQNNAFERIEIKRDLMDQQFEQTTKELESLDLRSYDRELQFYAGIQNEMKVPWIELMDTLATLLPDGVRIQVFSSEGLTRGNGEASTGAPKLRLLALARSKSAQLAFIKAMRLQPSFFEVLLKSELYEGNNVQFELSFGFLPKHEGGDHE